MKSAESKQKEKEEIGMKEEKVFTELGGETGPVFRAVRGFRLLTKPGPPENIEPGSLVRLSAASAVELFAASRVEPLTIGDSFIAKRAFGVVDGNGEWLWIAANDVIRLDKVEALKYLRDGLVKEYFEKGGDDES